MVRYAFQKYIYDSTESADRISKFQVGTMDINLVANYTPADLPFDFSLSVSPSSQPVTQGNSTTFAVSTALLAGITQPVGLGISGLPVGTQYSFSPQSGNPPFTSTLTILTNSSTPVGDYPLTITGIAPSTQKTIPITLNVLPIPPDKGTIQVSAHVGSVNVANGSGEIRNPDGVVVASFTSTPFSWTDAIVGITYTVVVVIPSYPEKTLTATVSSAGESVPVDFQFLIVEAGFPLWTVAVAGGAVAVYYLTKGKGKGGRRK